MRLTPLLMACAVAGCAGGDGLVPAGGRVTFRDGRPVSGGVVTFAPEAGGPEARAPIGPDGRFALTSGGKPGARPGCYRVAVVQLAPPDPAAAHAHGPKPPRTHGKHAKFETSGLTATIEAAGGEIAITVDVAN